LTLSNYSISNLAGMILRGLPLHQIYLYWYGNELGSHLPSETYT